VGSSRPISHVDIHFHISGIDFSHQVWKKLKSLFDRVDEIHIMQLEKELISLNPHSFDKIEDYLSCKGTLVEIG
jgi:hypothetical protein